VAARGSSMGIPVWANKDEVDRRVHGHPKFPIHRLENSPTIAATTGTEIKVPQLSNSGGDNPITRPPAHEYISPSRADIAAASPVPLTPSQAQALIQTINAGAAETLASMPLISANSVPSSSSKSLIAVLPLSSLPEATVASSSLAKNFSLPAATSQSPVADNNAVKKLPGGEKEEELEFFLERTTILPNQNQVGVDPAATVPAIIQVPGLHAVPSNTKVKADDQTHWYTQFARNMGGLLADKPYKNLQWPPSPTQN